MRLKHLQWLCGGMLALGAVTLCTLEQRRPHRRGQALLRRGAATDFVGYSVVQGYVLAQVVARIVEPLTTPPAERRLLARVPVYVQVPFFLVTHDFLLYWFHRWQHHSPLLWRTHEPHHGNTELDFLAGSRASPLEIVITELMKYLPAALLGAPPEVAIIRGTIDAIWGMYLHSNIDVRSGALQYVINGPEMHRWHHALDETARNKNFATKFALWDWLFGTAYWPKTGTPQAYGLPEGVHDGYLAQQLHSLRSLESSQRETEVPRSAAVSGAY